MLHTLLVVFLNSVTSAECWNWNPTTATGADRLSSVWKIAWLAVTKTSSALISGSSVAGKWVFISIRIGNEIDVIRTCTEWHWKDKTLRLDEMLFDGPFIPNLVHRTSIGCNEIIITVACEIHPSGESAVRCQKCSCYPKSLLQFISTPNEMSQHISISILHAFAVSMRGRSDRRSDEWRSLSNNRNWSQNHLLMTFVRTSNR